MFPPAIIDIGNDEDAGFWLAALAYVHFEVREHAADDVTEPLATIQAPDGEGTTEGLGAGPNFHETEFSEGMQPHHGA